MIQIRSIEILKRKETCRQSILNALSPSRLSFTDNKLQTKTKIEEIFSLKNVLIKGESVKQITNTFSRDMAKMKH